MIDNRRYERVPLALVGHFRLSDGLLQPCITRDMSGSGIAVSAQDENIRAGDRVTLQLEEIGEVEGQIVRSFDGGFAIALNIGPDRQMELADRMQDLFARSPLALLETPMTADGFVDESFAGLMPSVGARMTHAGETRVGHSKTVLRRNLAGQTEIEFRSQA